MSRTIIPKTNKEKDADKALHLVMGIIAVLLYIYIVSTD